METEPNPNKGMKTAFFTGFSSGCLGLFIGALAGTAFQLIIGVKAEGVLACFGLLLILGVGYAVFQFVKNFLVNRGFPPPSVVGIIIGIVAPFILAFIFSSVLVSIAPRLPAPTALSTPILPIATSVPPTVMLTPVSSTVTPITLTSGIGIGILVDTTGKPLPGTKMVLGVFEGMAQPSTDIIGQTGENGVIEKWTYRVAGFKFSIIKDPNNDSKYSQTTDEKGTFRIEDVPPGDYVLLAEEFRFPMPDFTLLPVKSGVSS